MTGTQEIIRSIQVLYSDIEKRIINGDDREKDFLMARMEELIKLENKIKEFS